MLCIPRVTFWENSPSREGKMLVETYFCIVQFFMLASFITMCIYYFCNKNKLNWAPTGEKCGLSESVLFQDGRRPFHACHVCCLSFLDGHMMAYTRGWKEPGWIVRKLYPITYKQ